MEFKENTAVVDSRGKKVGEVDRVVIDPRSKEVTHLVVRKGLLFTREKVIPMDRVETAREDEVVLKKGAEDPDAFPDFEETQHIPLDRTEPFRTRRGYARPFAWYYPLPGVAWWGVPYPSYSISPYVTRQARNIPAGTVPLEEGTKVYSSGGEGLGEVERIFTEPQENRVTHLLLSRGWISKEKKLIPSGWVESVGEEGIRLSVGKELIDGLPEYSEPG